jgi:hypothetical protein
VRVTAPSEALSPTDRSARAQRAGDSPQRLTDGLDAARLLLDLVPQVPTPVWGRDELAAGEMWNSNSLTSWLIVRSGLDVDSIHIPAGGRAPGWRAGIAIGRSEGEMRASR